MPRLAKTPGQPLTEILKTRLTGTEITNIDRARGHLSRSEWNRDLIRAALSPKSTAGEPQLHSSEVSPTPGHRHKRGDQIAVTGRGANRKIVYACTHPGCTEELS